MTFRSKPRNLAYGAALTLCCAAPVVSQPARASSPKYNFWIEQHAQAGPHKIQITEQGVKVESLKLRLCFQYKESDKMVTVWSEKDHTYYCVPYDEWISKFRNLVAAVGWYSELVKPSSVTAKVQDNLPYHVYHYRVDTHSPSYWSSDIGHAERWNGLEDIEFTTLDLPSKAAVSILQRIYDTPRVAGFPCSVKNITSQTSSLRTVRLERNFNKPIAFFRPTAAFKKTPFTNQILGRSFDDSMTKMILPY